MTNKGNHLATSNSTPRAQACIAPFTLWEAGPPSTAPTSRPKEQHLAAQVIPVTKLEAITTRDPLLPTERRAATTTVSTTAVPWAIRQAHPRGKRQQTRVLEVDLGRLRASLAPPDRDQGLQGSRMQPELSLDHRALLEVETSWASCHKEEQAMLGQLGRQVATPARRVRTAQPEERSPGRRLRTAAGSKFPRLCPAKSRKIPISSSSKCRHYSLERTLPL